MEEHSIRVERTARFFTLGHPGSETENVWVVFHGYGTLASQFLEQFELLNSRKNYVIAPEGLSRFYLRGSGGVVGASWMTKEDRLNEIQDYLDYINHVLEHTNNVIDLHRVKLQVLGFSQGVATMMRWAANCDFAIDNLVIWAGSLPPELDYTSFSHARKVWYLCGNQDRYISKERMEEQSEGLERLRAEIVIFEGQHEIKQDVLKELVSKT